MNSKGEGKMIKAQFSPETKRVDVVKLLLEIEENKMEHK